MNLSILVPTITSRSSSADRDFIDDALCAQTDPEAFFPEKGGSPKEAKAMCARCQVADACLQDALDNDEEFGVWGGLTARERKNLLAGRVVDERLLARLDRIRIPAAAADSDGRRLAG